MMNESMYEKLTEALNKRKITKFIGVCISSVLLASLTLLWAGIHDTIS